MIDSEKLPKTVICYLCGKNPATTKDHLFPRGIFNKPLPSNLPTLPACYKCNNDLSADEEIFRVFVCSGMAVENNVGKRMWDERIRPDLKGKRPKLKPLVQSMVKQAKVVTENGTILGYVPVLETNPDIINHVLGKIARGLFYLDTRLVLPPDIKVGFGYDMSNPKRLFTPPLDQALRESKKISFGNGEVTYWRNTMKDDPFTSITWIRFFEDKVFMILTGREELFNNKNN